MDKRIGNRFWEKRAKSGRNYAFTKEEIREAINQYKKGNNDNFYTWKGLAEILKCSPSSLNHMRKNTDWLDKAEVMIKSTKRNQLKNQNGGKKRKGYSHQTANATKHKYPFSKLYVLKVEHENIYKVGVSNNPERRIHDLRHSNYRHLEVVGVYDVDDAYGLECKIHQRFHDSLLQYEWFELNDYDVEKMQKMIKESYLFQYTLNIVMN